MKQFVQIVRRVTVAIIVTQVKELVLFAMFVTVAKIVMYVKIAISAKRV